MKTKPDDVDESPVSRQLPSAEWFVNHPEFGAFVVRSHGVKVELPGEKEDSDEGGRPRYQWVTDATAERYRQTPLTPWRTVYKVSTVAAYIRCGVDQGLSLATMQARVRSAVKARYKRHMKNQKGKKENVL